MFGAVMKTYYALKNNLDPQNVKVVTIMPCTAKKEERLMDDNIDAVLTTRELAEIIYQVIHKKVGEIDPATRTFQALRIAVNDELGELSRGLEGASRQLLKGGRLVVVDFHSLEDRIVKIFMRDNGGKKVRISKYAPDLVKENSLFTEVSKVIVPTVEECHKNPRARSAKLRYAVRG